MEGKGERGRETRKLAMEGREGERGREEIDRREGKR
jgi:hypothetical protein